MVHMKDDDFWSNVKKGATIALGGAAITAVGVVTAPIWGPVLTAASSSQVVTGIAGLVGGAVANGSKPV